MKIKKSMLALAIAILCCGITIGASAASSLQEIKAYLNSGITIQYNGETQILKDATGARIYPISYNGSTYLPIRAVSNMLGIGVDWDQATQTVLLGEQKNGVDLIDTIKPYTSYRTDPTYRDEVVVIQSADNKFNTIGGVDVTHWISMRNSGLASDSREEYTCSFNLGGKYTTLTFQAFSDQDTTIIVKGDNGAVLGQYNLVGNQVPQSFTVNLLNTTQLSFTRVKSATPDADARAVNAYIFDAILK